LILLAGVIAATFMCPLDVIKTRLQVHGLPPNSGQGGMEDFVLLNIMFYDNPLKNYELVNL
jgi:hypothetical protein